jgi:hypothetical protein
METMITPEQLAEIEERWKKSHRGEWSTEWQNGKTYLMAGGTCLAGFTIMSQRDCDFCAHAHQDIPVLIDEVERVTAQLADAVNGSELVSCGLAILELEEHIGRVTAERDALLAIAESIKTSLEEIEDELNAQAAGLVPYHEVQLGGLMGYLPGLRATTPAVEVQP